MRKLLAVITLATVATVGTVSPASAGEHTWNNQTSHYHSSTEHGQYSLGGGIYRAFTKHQNWAGLRIAVKYIAAGKIVTTGFLVSDHVASITEDKIHQHYSQW